MAATEWTERKKMIVTAAVGAAFNLVLGYFLYAASEDYAAKAASFASLNKKIADLSAFVKERPNKQRERDRLKQEFSAKESKLPDEEGLPGLIDSVAALAAQKKVENKGVTFARGDASTATAGYVRDVWHTHWEASLFDWCAFTNEMEERFKRFVSFENLSMGVKNAGMVPSGTKEDFNVDIVTYRYAKKL